MLKLVSSLLLTSTVLGQDEEEESSVILDDIYQDSEVFNYETKANLILCSAEGEDCYCHGSVYYVPQTNQAGLTLSDIRENEYVVQSSTGTISCDTDTFFRDPAIGEPKQCVCASTEPVSIPKTRVCAEEGETCQCQGRVLFSSFDSLLNKDSLQSYAAKEPWGGSILCDVNEFGTDPAPDQPKYCFCTSSVVQTPAVPLKTHGTKIRDQNNDDVSLSCANWYGADLEAYVPEGLDQAPLDFISKVIGTLGFNCVRLPFSLELYFENPRVLEESVSANENMVGWSSMLVFDKIIENLTENGLMVVLNNRMSDAGKCCSTNDGNGMWYNSNYPSDKFFQAWRDLANRYLDNSMVVGCDLRNEPRPDETNGLMPTWGSGLEHNDWKLAAQTAGDEILAINSNVLIIVQGISFGSNLKGVAEFPIELSVENRLVYSVHVWDHQISQFHFNSWENTYDAFDQMFNFINDETWSHAAPIFIGEFATATMSSNYWQYIVKYLHDSEMSWGYWSVNSANQGDGDTHASGVMNTDWFSVTDFIRVQNLQTIMRGVEIQGYVEGEDLSPLDINHHILPISGEQDPSQASGMFGLVAFLSVCFSISLWTTTASSEITFATLQNAGASLNFVMAMLITGVELVLWPISYLESPTIAYIFLFWSEITKWYMTTAYWFPTIILAISLAKDSADLHMDTGVFLGLDIILGLVGMFILWVNIRPLYVHYEYRFPGDLWERYGIDIVGDAYLDESIIDETIQNDQEFDEFEGEEREIEEPSGDDWFEPEETIPEPNIKDEDTAEMDDWFFDEW